MITQVGDAGRITRGPGSNLMMKYSVAQFERLGIRTTSNAQNMEAFKPTDEYVNGVTPFLISLSPHHIRHSTSAAGLEVIHVKFPFPFEYR